MSSEEHCWNQVVSQTGQDRRVLYPCSEIPTEESLKERSAPFPLCHSAQSFAEISSAYVMLRKRVSLSLASMELFFIVNGAAVS